MFVKWNNDDDGDVEEEDEQKKLTAFNMNGTYEMRESKKSSLFITLHTTHIGRNQVFYRA